MMAGNSTLKFELHGTPDLERRLRLLADNVAERVVKKAIRKAAGPIVSAASRNALTTRAPTGERLGGLSKSMGVVVRNYRHSHKVLGIIGPLRGKVYTRKGKKEVPAMIAHLVEFGHRVAVGGSLAPLKGSVVQYKTARSAVVASLFAAEPGTRQSPLTARGKRRLASYGFKRAGSWWIYTGKGEFGKYDDFKVGQRYRFGTIFNNRPLRGGGVQKGFVQGQPFLRPAWDSQKSAAQSVLETELRNGIEAEASK